MDMTFDDLAKRLQPHYSGFKVSDRLLFTGHSHQAWPDVCLDGLIESYTTAASMVDDKWNTVFEKVEILRNYLRRFYDDPHGRYCFSENTHNLVVRWLSSFDLNNKPRIVTTDSEFHSINRQLTRLEETGIEIERVPALPLDGFSQRFEKALDDHTAAALISHVYFSSSLVNSELTACAEASERFKVPLLIDDYHGTNVIRTSIAADALASCYLLIGGYKYLQWGEGNCFLRFPSDCTLRPVITGWFSAFDKLAAEQTGNVLYDDGDNRFMGGTFDGASQFRAARTVDFFEKMDLNPEILHRSYQNQVRYMRKQFLALDMDSSKIRAVHDYPINRNGGFLAMVSPMAREIWMGLKRNGVYTDYRNDILRMGPAPYITRDQIDEAFRLLNKVVDAI